MHFYRKCWFDPFEEQFIFPFLSDCPSLLLGIAIHCIQHSQAMLERGVCELAHSFFHWNMSGGKYSLHKIMNYWNMNTFNQQWSHFRGKHIHVHGSNALDENKSQENETSKKKLWIQKYKFYIEYNFHSL